mmetsp:Transcript_106183/g.307280  ORF Transcript_106183/g.307280 Transcript_106183/m.307280 type:complete len:293 (+) Transcript_106183:1264-2142(+)
MKSSHVLELRVDERAALRAEQHVARLHLPRHLAGHDLHDVVSERINGSFGVLESDAGEVGLGVIHWSEVHRAATRLQQQEVVEGREGRGAGAVDNRGDGHLLLFGDIPQLVGELGGRDRVEAGGRLVQEEDPRVRHELECHVHALTPRKYQNDWLTWPPDIPRMTSSPMMLSITWSSLSFCNTDMTSSRLRSADHVRGSRMSAENMTFWKTVRRRCMTSSCGTKPTSAFHEERLLHSTPLTRIVPEVFLALPVTRFMMVVLPAPLAPMIAVVRPGLKEPETPRMICVPLGRV